MTREFNIDPSKTTFGGNCTARLVTLALRSGNLLLVLQFAMVRARRPAQPASRTLGPPSSVSKRLALIPQAGQGRPGASGAVLRPLPFVPAWEGPRVQVARE